MSELQLDLFHNVPEENTLPHNSSFGLVWDEMVPARNPATVVETEGTYMQQQTLDLSALGAPRKKTLTDYRAEILADKIMFNTKVMLISVAKDRLARELGCDRSNISSIISRAVRDHKLKRIIRHGQMYLAQPHYVVKGSETDLGFAKLRDFTKRKSRKGSPESYNEPQPQPEPVITAPEAPAPEERKGVGVTINVLGHELSMLEAREVYAQLNEVFGHANHNHS